jgi:hypothetical protein
LFWIFPFANNNEHADDGNKNPHDPKKKTACYRSDIVEESEGDDKIGNKEKHEPGQPCPKNSCHYHSFFLKSFTSLSNQPFDFPQAKAWGLPRVDTERRFHLRPKGRSLVPSKYQYNIQPLKNKPWKWNASEAVR